LRRLGDFSPRNKILICRQKTKFRECFKLHHAIIVHIKLVQISSRCSVKKLEENP
jgi:hypothetical protein